MAEENHVYYVGLLVPDGMKQDAFYDEIYERLFPQHGIYKPEEQKTALEELKTHARNLAFEGSMEAASPFSRDIANLLVKCSGKNLQMQDGRLINPAVYQGEVRQNAPEEQRELTAAERAFTAEIRRRAVIGHALKEGTLCCLPGKDGYADTSPAVNVANGTWYHGATLLQLKEHQKSNGFPSAEYVTQEAVHKSGIPLREGQKGVEISFSVKHEDSGEWEHKAVRLFNVAQTARPWEMKAWAAKQLEEKAQDKEAYLKSQFGDSYKPREASGRKPGPEIVCTSSEPEKYLGQYLAAVSTGGRFKATAEQGAAFKQKFGDALWEKTVTLENGEKRTNPFKLSKICNGANEQCKEVIKEIRGEQKAEQKRQQQQIPNRGRGL